ncbi:MAG: flagellar biosynthetic protein FliO [Calditrichaeota bacterium]|nr:flagellar biosynthetic protein FliO [Calditrichota bacterium]
MKRGLFYILTPLVPAAALLAQPSDPQAPAGAETPELGWLVFKAVAMLILILALIFLLVFFIKKVWGRQLGIIGDQEWFQVVARAPLHAQHSIALVKVFDRFLLLGITESSISNLGELQQSPQLMQWIEKNQVSSGAVTPNVFWSLLKKKVEK